MHLSRPAAAVVVTLACAAGLALSGCSNAATGSTDPSSFANVSGSAVAVADDIGLRPDSVPVDTLIAVLRSFLDTASEIGRAHV